MAWYAPGAGAAIGVRSTKAIPGESRDLGSDSTPSSDPVPTQIPWLPQAVFAAALLLEIELQPASKVLATTPRICPSWYFSPQISFRPPPSQHPSS
jgi:hypothetical protein